MTVLLQTGCAARSVTSGAAVPLLGADVADVVGFALANASRWCLVVETTENVTVRVYKASGANAALVILASLTTVATAAAPFVLEADGEASQRLYVTAQAVAATASVNCDLRAVSSS